MLPIPVFEQKNVLSLFAILAYIGLTLLGLYVLYRLSPLIPPFLVATIIAMTLTPEVDRLERTGLYGLKIKRGAAIGLIYLLFLAVCAFIIRLIPLVAGQMVGLITVHIPPELLHGSSQTATELSDRWMNRLHVPSMMRPSVTYQAQHLPELLGNGLLWFRDNLPGLAGNLIWVVIVPIITFFILLDFNKILGKFLLLVKRDRREGILKVVTDIIAVLGAWVRGVLTVMALDMGVIFVTLWVTGMVLGHQHPTPGKPNLSDYALTLAVTAGVLYTIPYFGAVVSTALIGLVTLSTHGVVPALVVTGLMILIHQVVFDNIIAPRVIGGSVHLHPLLTLLALMGGGTLFGIGGTLLAVPVAAAAQVVLVHLFPQFKTSERAERRAANVVQATIAREDEAEKPPARKAGDAPILDAETATARAAAQTPTDNAPPLLPPAPS